MLAGERLLPHKDHRPSMAIRRDDLRSCLCVHPTGSIVRVNMIACIRAYIDQLYLPRVCAYAVE